jgi:hypothetical protein
MPCFELPRPHTFIHVRKRKRKRPPKVISVANTAVLGSLVVASIADAVFDVLVTLHR